MMIIIIIIIIGSTTLSGLWTPQSRKQHANYFHTDTCNEISHDQQWKQKFMSRVSQTVSVATFMS